MSQIVIGKSSGHNVTLDLDTMITTRLLVQANSGGGKSFALRRILEQAYGKVQCIVVDPAGEFSTLREKLDFVLVGEGGETPADIRSAALLATRLLELRANAVCDLYSLKPAERHTWVKRFLSAVMNSPKKLWHPVLFVVDEAHKFMPEKGEGDSEAKDEMLSLCSDGRKYGFCAVLATQRLAKLDKSGAAELTNVLIGPTFIDVDLERAHKALGIINADKKGFNDQMKTVDPGNFWAFGRAISKERILVKIGGVETTHPEAGATKYAATPPPAPEKIKAMLPKLADLPKAAEEKARTEADYKKQIRELRAENGMLMAKVGSREAALRATAGKPDGVDKGYIPDLNRQIREWKKLCGDKDAAYAKLEQQFTNFTNNLSQLLARFLGGKKVPVAVARPDRPPPDPNKGYRVEWKPVQPIPKPLMQQGSSLALYENSNGTKLRDGAERMLAALAQWAPNGMALGQMRAHAGLKKSGTFSAYMSDLRKGGYIREDGSLVFATDAGLDYCKHIPEAPSSTEDVLSVWIPKLRDGAVRMLKVLVEARGEAISKEELGERAGLKKSGTFSAYLSDLKTARLVVVHRDSVAADRESLFL